MNKIIHCDCLSDQGFYSLGDESLDFIVSSPPYFNLREYAEWKTYNDHLVDVAHWFKEMFRVIKPGRHVCWNIQDNTPEPSKDGRHYHALMPDTVKLAIHSGFEWERNVYWNKRNATQVMFGSYPYPPTMVYSCVTETICIFRKPGDPDLSNKSEKSKLDKKEWNEYKNNLWTFPPQSASVKHPAPYPVELPARCIKMHSFVGDLVLDPFMGSGTTAVAAMQLDRKYLGFEKHEEYIKLSHKRTHGTINDADGQKYFDLD